MTLIPWPSIIASLAGGSIFLLEAYTFMRGFLTELTVGYTTLGITTIISGLMLYRRPEQHFLWGGAVVISALIAVILTGAVVFFTPYILGPLVASIGGVTGFVWELPSDSRVQRPGVASILSFLGGLILLVSESFLIAVSHFWSGGPLTVFEILTMTASLIVTIGALFLYARPSEHLLWGSLVIVMALTTLLGLGALWGTLIVPLIGGIAGLLWKPSQGS